jgi:hypothetical protein
MIDRITSQDLEKQAGDPSMIQDSHFSDESIFDWPESKQKQLKPAPFRTAHTSSPQTREGMVIPIATVQRFAHRKTSPTRANRGA